MSNSIATLLKGARQEKRISAQALANILGVSRQTIYKWERGSAAPSHDHLLELSKILGIDLGTLNREKPQVANPSTYLVQKFLENLQKARSLMEIRIATTRYTLDMGMSHFFYKQMYRGDLSSSRRAIVVTDAPVEWLNQYREKSYIQIDPTWKYSLTNVKPILGYELFAQARKQPNPELMLFYRDLFLNASPHYVIIPVHGACCMATYVVQLYGDSPDADHSEYMLERIESLTLAAHYLFHCVHELGVKTPIHPETPLTNREIDTIRLLASGMSIKAIADSLSISIATVNARLNSAKIKLGAPNREAMVLAASARNLLPHDIKELDINTMYRHARS